MVRGRAPREPCRIVDQREAEYLQQLGRNLKGARARAGWTQEQVARAIDMNPRQYAKLEAGSHDSGILKYARAMHALHAPMGDLFRDAELAP